MGENNLKPGSLEDIEKWIKKVEDMDHSRKNSSGKHASQKLKLSYKVIGEGKSRIVFDLENGSVLKIAFSVRGIKDIQSEVTLYESSPSTVKNHLAEVIDYGHGWCIMKKIENVASNSKEYRDLVYRNLVYKLRDEFLREGIIPDDLTNRRNDEPRWKNFGIDKQGQIVVIDYGNFKKQHSTILHWIISKIPD